jgi:hypothetical protein
MMAKKIARVMVKGFIILVLAFGGLVFGTITGMDIGGNYFTNFVFLGARGYEATGMIGSFVGITLGVFAGILLVRLIFKKK